MQQGWDDLDKSIADAFEDINVKEGYNYRLMSKIKKKKQTKIQVYTFAFSLIMAGFLIMFMYTPDVQYRIADVQCRIKSDIISLQNNYDLLKSFRGE